MNYRLNVFKCYSKLNSASGSLRQLSPVFRSMSEILQGLAKLRLQKTNCVFSPGSITCVMQIWSYRPSAYMLLPQWAFPSQSQYDIWPSPLHSLSLSCGGDVIAGLRRIGISYEKRWKAILLEIPAVDLQRRTLASVHVTFPLPPVLIHTL